jgi:hypothetical protein
MPKEKIVTNKTPRTPPPPSSDERRREPLSVQDALIVLAVRLMGRDIRHNPSARQHIIALARAAPLFRAEDYGQTEGRINRFVNRAGTKVMDDLFAQALNRLRADYRREALAWSAVNAVTQQLTDEMGAMLHHIGSALGFTASEVEASLAKARGKPPASAGEADASGLPGGESRTKPCDG